MPSKCYLQSPNLPLNSICAENPQNNFYISLYFINVPKALGHHFKSSLPISCFLAASLQLFFPLLPLPGKTAVQSFLLTILSFLCLHICSATRRVTRSVLWCSLPWFQHFNYNFLYVLENESFLVVRDTKSSYFLIYIMLANTQHLKAKYL